MYRIVHTRVGIAKAFFDEKPDFLRMAYKNRNTSLWVLTSFSSDGKATRDCDELQRRTQSACVESPSSAGRSSHGTQGVFVFAMESGSAGAEAGSDCFSKATAPLIAPIMNHVLR